MIYSIKYTLDWKEEDEEKETRIEKRITQFETGFLFLRITVRRISFSTSGRKSFLVNFVRKKQSELLFFDICILNHHYNVR